MLLHDDFVVAFMNNCLGYYTMSNMFNFSNYTSVGPDKFVESTEDVVIMSESILLHNMEQFADHLVAMGGSMSDD